MEYKLKKSLEGHQGAVYAISKATEEHLVYTAGSDRKVIEWDLESLKPTRVIAKSPTTVISLCFIKELKILLIGQVEGGVHVIDIEKGAEIKYLKAHKGYIFDIKYITHKKEIVFCSGDGSFSVWSAIDYKMLLHEKIANGKIRDLAISLERNEACFATGDGEAVVFNQLDWTEKSRINNESVAINSVKYIYENRLLFGDKMAHLSEVDLLTNQIIQKLPAHNWPIYSIDQGDNTDLFATGSRDKTVKIWDANHLKVLKRFEGFKDQAHTHSVNKILWIKYKDYLLSTGDDGKLKVWTVS